MVEQHAETLEEFRKSFNYGSRNDLLFKFLGSRGVTDEDAASFFQGLLEHIGDATDTGDFSNVLRHIYEAQVDGYTPKEQSGGSSGFEYDTAPWTPMAKPLSQSRLALISAGGLYVEGDDRNLPGAAIWTKRRRRSTRLKAKSGILCSGMEKICLGRYRS